MKPFVNQELLSALKSANSLFLCTHIMPDGDAVGSLLAAGQILSAMGKRCVLACADDVPIGIMIETPAAAIMSDRLAKEVDFFSCGTNDLTQYTLACDRQNNDLGRFFNPHHPAVLRLLKMVCDNAHKNGIWVGICGELGADLSLTETFLSIGVDELSVSPRAVLPLRQKVRETDVRVVREKLVAELMGDANSEL